MGDANTTEESIRRLLEGQVAAWNAGDAAAWCKDFTSDSVFVNILGMRFDGRENNARRHGELFAGVFKGSRLELHALEIRLLGDCAAIAGAVLDLKHFRGLPPGIRPTIGNEVLRTRMHYALIREGARWWIVFSQNTAVMPMPPLA
ncbi:MAG TPA: SgcJ/EcaC family oxidoreductase [Rhodanobacteraceae bacterium]|nr:SgcJ/EcaC family oxidoreductase [Rhodanobacteraceae bacterium]